MPADRPFFDTSYLVRLYLEDKGFEAVRERAGAASVLVSAWHAQAEVAAALHRAFREKRFKRSEFHAAMEQFISDREQGLFEWLPLAEPIQRRLESVFHQAPATAFLRGADALHLACASEYGHTEVFSNDRHFLAAAPLFGLKPVNLIA